MHSVVLLILDPSTIRFSFDTYTKTRYYIMHMKKHPELTEERMRILKQTLLAEKAKLEAELPSIGAQNPSNPADWVPNVSDLSTDEADRNEAADKFEELQTNMGIVNELEYRLRNINRALEKMEKGEYGFSEITGEPIEFDRLEANPAARTEKAHMSEEDTLPL